MNYTINIENAREESGKILLDRLIDISTSIIKISEGALQLKLLGVSKKKGRKRIDFTDSLSISLIQIKSESTALVLECEPFSSTLKEYQQDLFNTDFFNHTPVSVVIDCYKKVLDDESNEEDLFLDRPLIGELKKLANSFKSNEEIITLSNDDAITGIQLTKDIIESIKVIEQEIPEDQKLIVTGLLEELKFSKYRVKIQIENELLNAYISEDIDTGVIAKYWGKEVTFGGIMHYGLKKTKNFEITRIFEDADSDENYFFKEIPEQTKLIEVRPKNPLMKIKGQWPGDETFEDLINSI